MECDFSYLKKLIVFFILEIGNQLGLICSFIESTFNGRYLLECWIIRSCFDHPQHFYG